MQSKINSQTSKDVNKKYLFMLLLDHCHPDFFFNIIDQGLAPNISKYILGKKLEQLDAYSNATICKNVVTGFPSTSANMHTSILTGTVGGKNNIFQYAYWNFFGKKPKIIRTDDLKITTIKKFNNNYLNPNTKLIFEFFKTSSSYHVINRGAKWKMFTLKTIIFNYLPLLINLQKKDEPGRLSPLARPELWKKMLLKNIGKFLLKVKKEYLPEVNYLVFLLTDENAHRFGYNSTQYKEAIQIIDLYIKSLVEGIDLKDGRHIDGLEELGYFENIIWNIHTDHSGRPIERHKYISINRYLEAEFGLKLIEGPGNKTKPEKRMIKKSYNLKSIQNINAYSVCSGELWTGWFRDSNLNSQTNLEQFIKFHGEKLFRNLKPLNNEVITDFTSNFKIDLINLLIKKEFIQFVIVPEELDQDFDFYINEIKKNFKIHLKQRIFNQIPRKYTIKIFSNKGSSIIKRFYENNSIYYSYEILQNQNPLDYDEINIEYGKKYSQSEILKLTFNHKLPDVFFRLFGFFDCVFAPNFLITSEYTYQFLPRHESLDKFLLKSQNHDGLYSIESVVPLVFAGKDVRKGYKIPFARNVDIIPTLLKLMNIEFKENIKYLDGVPLL